MLRRGSACDPKIDVDGIHLTSKAARFRVASRSAQRSTGMARIRAGKEHCGRISLIHLQGAGMTNIFALRLPISLPLPFIW